MSSPKTEEGAEAPPSRLARFLRATFWEGSQNLPLILGFMLALHLFEGGSYLGGGLAYLLCISAGATYTHFTEEHLSKDNKRPPLSNLFRDILLFTLLGVPLLFYFRAPWSWTGWHTDLLLGAVAGAALALAQSRSADTKKAKREILHGLAMAGASPLILLSMRLSMQLQSWLGLAALVLIVSALASALIVWIEYGEVWRDAEDTQERKSG